MVHVLAQQRHAVGQLTDEEPLGQALRLSVRKAETAYGGIILGISGQGAIGKMGFARQEHSPLKLEIRNAKSEGNPKHETRNRKQP